MIQISEAAAKEIKRLQLSRQLPNSILKLGIKPGGCSGLTYILELKPDIEQKAEIIQINSITVKLEPESYKYIKDLKIDYSEDLMGGGFRFQNPNASSTCSCGQSFSIDATVAGNLENFRKKS